MNQENPSQSRISEPQGNGPVEACSKRKFRPIRLAPLVLVGLLGTGCLGLAILFGNCGILAIPVAVALSPAVVASDKAAEAIEHAKGPIPETEWNKDNLWYRVSDAPPTYLPKGFSRGRSTGPDAGFWMVDERDGKRLFIPRGGLGAIPEGTYQSVARYATQWRPRNNSMGGSLDITPKTLLLGVP